MGCTSSKSIDVNDLSKDRPPDPKVIGGHENKRESFTISNGRPSIITTETTTSDASDGNPADSHDDGILGNAEDTHEQPSRKLSWAERRNSDKEKESFVKQRSKAARLELGRRLSYRSVIYARCPRCGDLGPDHCNQYYGYWLVVPEIQTKSKCRRCNLAFSYEHYGVVKDIPGAINIILDEFAE